MLECIKVTMEVKEKQSLEPHKESRSLPDTLCKRRRTVSPFVAACLEAPVTVKDVVEKNKKAKINGISKEPCQKSHSTICLVEKAVSLPRAKIASSVQNSSSLSSLLG